MGRPGKPEVSQIALRRIDNFVYWNGIIERDTDLGPTVPDDLRVVDKPIPDVDQVKTERP